MKKIICMGIVAILLVTGFSTISAATQIKVNDTSGVLEVKLVAKNNIGQNVFIQDASVEIQEFDESDVLVDTKSLEFLKEQLWICTIYGIEYNDIDVFKSDEKEGYTYKIIVSKDGYETASSKVFAAFGIYNQIVNDAPIRVDLEKSKAKSVHPAFLRLLDMFPNAFPVLRLLLQRL